ncbi:GDSL-type esterase/lipase family protein [Rhodoplanes sp. SY1]|uniref:GDSL-type esterase/lipase family protein n=1 Tax=Rhodoplanes sp. SY1 TaxID=3166646 RepID=UPI0038B58764
MAAITASQGVRAIPWPTPSNNLVVWFGDSRTFGISADPPDTKSITAGGQASWAAHGAGYRCNTIRAVGNRGIGGDTTADMLARISDVVNSGAGVCVFLGGVNDNTDTAATIANYGTIFDTLSAANIVTIVCNELPDDTAGHQPYQIIRRDWLENPARRVTWPKLLQVDTFRPCLKDGTTCNWKDGYAPDGLHPGVYGAKAIGGTLGPTLAQLFAAYSRQDNLPTGAGDAYNASTNPGGCLLSNYMMTGTGGTATGVNGQVPTGWAYNVAQLGTGLTVDVTIDTDADGYARQNIHCYGTSSSGTRTLIFQCLKNDAPTMGYVAAGDRLRSQCHLTVDAGAQGLRGAAVGCQIVGNNGTSQSQSVYNFWGSSSGWISEAFDGAVVSQYVTVHADWATMTGRSMTDLLNMQINGSATVDFTVRVSRFGRRKLLS